jgi:anti-anti-sigma factor
MIGGTARGSRCWAPVLGLIVPPTRRHHPAQMPKPRFVTGRRVTAGASFSHDGGYTGKVVSEVDMSNAGQLRHELEQFTTGNLVINSADLEIIDSSGLNVIAVAHERLLDAGGQMRLVTCSEPSLALLAKLDSQNGWSPRPRNFRSHVIRSEGDVPRGFANGPRS